MLKRISSSIFSSRLFTFLFAQELALMQVQTITSFKAKTMAEIMEKRRLETEKLNLHAEKIAATAIVSDAIQINKAAAMVNEDKMIKAKANENVRFQKKYGQAVEK